MDKKYYIQRTGENARDLWRLFQIVANLGVGTVEPTEAINGDVFVNSSSNEAGVYDGLVFQYTPLVQGNYVYDEPTLTTYLFNGVSLEVDYNYQGVIVSKTDKLTSLPDRKEAYSEDWKDEQGDDTFLSESTYYKSKNVEVEFFMKSSDRDSLRIKTDAFLRYATAKGYVNYFDTLKGQGFRGYYKTHVVKDEKFRDGLYWQQFNITFVVDQLCYGYDTTQCGVLLIDIDESREGFYDLYLSDGTQLLKTNEDSYVSSESSIFVIIVPQYLDLVSVSCGQANPIGVQSSGDHVIGVQSGGDFVLGI